MHELPGESAGRINGTGTTQDVAAVVSEPQVFRRPSATLGYGDDMVERHVPGVASIHDLTVNRTEADPARPLIAFREQFQINVIKRDALDRGELLGPVADMAESGVDVSQFGRTSPRCIRTGMLIAPSLNGSLVPFRVCRTPPPRRLNVARSLSVCQRIGLPPAARSRILLFSRRRAEVPTYRVPVDAQFVTDAPVRPPCIPKLFDAIVIQIGSSRHARYVSPSRWNGYVTPASLAGLITS